MFRTFLKTEDLRNMGGNWKLESDIPTHLPDRLEKGRPPEHGWECDAQARNSPTNLPRNRIEKTSGTRMGKCDSSYTFPLMFRTDLKREDFRNMSGNLKLEVPAKHSHPGSGWTWTEKTSGTWMGIWSSSQTFPPMFRTEFKKEAFRNTNGNSKLEPHIPTDVPGRLEKEDPRNMDGNLKLEPNIPIHVPDRLEQGWLQEPKLEFEVRGRHVHPCSGQSGKRRTFGT
jgi:hypothetical protein